MVCLHRMVESPFGTGEDQVLPWPNRSITFEASAAWYEDGWRSASE